MKEVEQSKEKPSRDGKAQSKDWAFLFTGSPVAPTVIYRAPNDLHLNLSAHDKHAKVPVEQQISTNKGTRMWLMTNIGFFSAVQKPGTAFLTIRARVRNDLDNLRQKYLPELSPTIGHAGTDYPWRATIPHESFATALGKIAMDINYPNFKNEVAAKQGKARAGRYGKVWSALYDMPEEAPTEPVAVLPWNEKIPSGKKVAYGGVIFDANGLVLLREPKNHFDNYVWTFAKGRPDPGESPQTAALREAKEETGADATIVAPLPGEFAGGTTINRYFIMQAAVGSGHIKPDDKETASIKWLTVEAACQHIAQTTNPTGKQRDLDVLTAALAFREK